MKYIIANWKANMTLQTSYEWITSFKKILLGDIQLKNSLTSGEKLIIICPPSPFIPVLKKEVEDIDSLLIGSQDVSKFKEGSYTGEVTAKSLTGLVSYAIVGHSERRAQFAETDEIIKQKVNNARSNGIKTIVCMRGGQDVVPEATDLLAYEPVNAIGTGNNAPVSDVLAVKATVLTGSKIPFIYGGSVNPENCHEYLEPAEIDGVLVGSASLNPISFGKIAMA